MWSVMKKIQDTEHNITLHLEDWLANSCNLWGTLFLWGKALGVGVRWVDGQQNFLRNGGTIELCFVAEQNYRFFLVKKKKEWVIISNFLFCSAKDGFHLTERKRMITAVLLEGSGHITGRVLNRRKVLECKRTPWSSFCTWEFPQQHIRNC